MKLVSCPNLEEDFVELMLNARQARFNLLYNILHVGVGPLEDPGCISIRPEDQDNDQSSKDLSVAGANLSIHSTTFLHCWHWKAQMRQ